MFMEKVFKGMKLHTYAEPRGYEQVSDHVSGYFSQNQLASCVDTRETICRFNQGGHIPMSRM